jgi:cellulose biosynthesis protein BcsQ
MKVLTFFNNKGGVGKTTMVYHISCMLAEMGYRVISVDLDPQSNLTSMFLPIERLEEIFENESNSTILGSIVPVIESEGYNKVHIEEINENIGLLIGNLALSAYEDNLSDAWLKCLNGDIYAFKVVSVFNTLIQDAADRFHADIVLIDVGPNLGAINRAVTIGSDYLIMPVSSDLFSLQGIKNLGQTLKTWKKEWEERRAKNPKPDVISLPKGNIEPTGYVIMQYTAKESRPVKSYLKWADRIPATYHEFVLDREISPELTIDTDDECLGLLKHYHSLAPMSMEAHKPMFLLKPADGAIGAHVQAVKKCYADFQQLTQRIIDACQASG